MRAHGLRVHLDRVRPYSLEYAIIDATPSEAPVAPLSGVIKMTMIASCSCGSLTAEIGGDPVIVGICHCTQCQRRTGSVFGVGAYFRKEGVRTSGASTIYVRDGQDGRKVQTHFCPTCGSTVFWFLDFFPDFLGIAVGAFGDPAFTRPVVSVWEQTRHPWVSFGHDVEHHIGAVQPTATQ